VNLVCVKPLPRSFKRHPNAKGLVAEADISPLGLGRRSKLFAKLLIWNSPKEMQAFWKHGLDKPIGRRALGAVNSMCYEEWHPDGAKRLLADPRYFCLISLCLGELSMVIISHEAVHAGFAYEKRIKRCMFQPAMDFDEERIAYPAGYIAAAINRFCDKQGLYEMKPSPSKRGKRQ